MLNGYNINILYSIQAILNMHIKQQYSDMVLFWMTCHSGSMFEDVLRHDINVYAVSSCKPDEFSKACELDETIGTPLCSVFGKAWMSGI